MTHWPETPAQTAGPYVHLGCLPNGAGVEGVYAADSGRSIAGPDARGDRIVIAGRLLDGAGEPVTDGLLEAWQADGGGRFPGEVKADPACAGWGRVATGRENGAWAFETVMPGSVKLPGGGAMAPHILLWVVARGINAALTTRVYLTGDEAVLAADPVWQTVPAKRRGTLLARPEGDGRWRHDIRLQGEGETVFFDL